MGLLISLLQACSAISLKEERHFPVLGVNWIEMNLFICLTIPECSVMAEVRVAIYEIWCFAKGVNLLKK
jgi:hypothetical protein